MTTTYLPLADSSLHGQESSLEQEIITNTLYEVIQRLYSKSTFSWLNPVLRIAKERALQQNDGVDLPSKCRSKLNYHYLQEHWDGKDKNKTLYRAIFINYGIEYCCSGGFLVIMTCLSFTAPLILKLLIGCAEKNASWREISYYIVALFFTKVGVAFL